VVTYEDNPSDDDPSQESSSPSHATIENEKSFNGSQGENDHEAKLTFGVKETNSMQLHVLESFGQIKKFDIESP
jgi:hypothetical protein